MAGVVALLILLEACTGSRIPEAGLDNSLFTVAGKLSPANSGIGRLGDNYLYAPGIRFPLEIAPAYINSQVYGVGGLYGAPGGGQCDIRNYQYPWHDNYCEKRRWGMPLCPAGKGHQGVDIRPASCEKNKYWAVAVEEGVITGVGDYIVYLRGQSSGTTYRYLHLDSSSIQVGTGQHIRRGQRIGLVSDNMGNTKTTIHLHFDMKQTIRLSSGRSVKVFVPPYTSLVAAYQQLLQGRSF